MMVTEFLQFCKLDRVFTSISSFIFRSSSARRGTSLRGFRDEKPLSGCFMGGLACGLVALVQKSRRGSPIQPENHPAHHLAVPSRFSPLASHLITRRAPVGGTGEERERQKGGAARRNNFVTCPIRRRSLIRDATCLLKPEATAICDR